MAIEIERKFRIVGESWRPLVTKTRNLRQAYLAYNDRISMRVRIDDGKAATLTIKTVAPGIERHEYEYPIPVADAENLLDRREGAVISKTRHLVPAGGLVWEIDLFTGDNEGLRIAEVELDHAEQVVECPEWIGEEVTGDRRFYNADLSQHPFSRW